MQARRSFQVLRRWAWLLVAAVLFAGGAAFLVSSALPKTYQGTVTLIVGQSLQSTSPDYNQLLASQRLSQTYADLVTTQPLLARVIDRTGLATTTAELRELVTSDASRDSTLVTISVTDHDPVRVALIANTIAEELIAASPAINGRNSDVQQFVDRDLDAVQAQIGETQLEVERLAGLTVRTMEQESRLQALQGRQVALRQTYASLLEYSSTSGSNLLTIVDPAQPPTDAASPRILLNTVAAAVIGLLLALAVAFALEYLDDTLKSPDDVEAATGMPVLGAIIRMKGDEGRLPIYRLATVLYPRSPAAEAYRSMRTNIEFAGVDRPVRVILVTSSIPGEGKTTTAANLAAVFAQAGHPTLLVDVDLRRPSVHRLFGLQNGGGLTNLLRTDEVQVADVAQATDQEHLRVITAGLLPPNPSELIRSARMRRVVERLAAAADFVVLDSPPLRAVTDAAILSSLADGTVLVIDAGRTRRGAVGNGLDALERVNARVLGVVLNRMSESAAGEYYYDDYAVGYDAERDPPEERLPKAGKLPVSAK